MFPSFAAMVTPSFGNCVAQSIKVCSNFKLSTEFLQGTFATFITVTGAMRNTQALWIRDEIIIPSKLSPKPVNPWCSPDENPWGRCRRVSSCRCKWAESKDSRSMLRDTLDAKLVIEVTIPTIKQIQITLML